jgi:DNA polymerase I
MIQILDINYISASDCSPIIQIFGLDVFGFSHIIKVRDFRPYFYCSVQDGHINDVISSVNKLNLDNEVVKRFKPIGYQSKSVQMLKIYTISPKDVRETREVIRVLPYVENIYEADVLFHDRFAADTGVMSMKWIEVGSNNVTVNDITLIEDPEDAPLSILSLDIECLPPASGKIPLPENDPIILVSLAFNHGYKNTTNMVLVAKDIKCGRNDIISLQNETLLLKKLVKIIKEYDPDIITGYNVTPFDLNYIAIRMQKNNVSCNIGRDGSSLYVRKSGINTDATIAGRVVIDTLSMVRRNYSLSQYTLKNVALELLHLQKLDVPASKMREYWLDDSKLPEFIKYSRRDAVLGMQLLTELGMLQKYLALSKMSGLLLQQIVTSGQTSMLEFMLLQRINKANRVVNMKPKSLTDEDISGFEGAYVSEPTKNLCEHLILTDMQSLYPSIIISNNLCPTTILLEESCSGYIITPNNARFATDVRGILPKMLDEMLKKRLETKQKMKACQDPKEKEVLDSIQYAYKIALNSAYGLCGYPRSRTFVIDIAAAVTSFGRNTIQKVRSDVEAIKDLEVNSKKFNFQVIYTDTDSAYIELLCDQEITFDDANTVGNTVTKIISKPMKYPMKLNYEGYASRALFLTKKRYAMCLISKKGDVLSSKIKVKGIEVVRRDWCQFTGETMSKVLDLILNQGDTKGAYLCASSAISRVRDLRNLKSDLELANKLVLSRKVGNVDSYKSKQPHVEVYKKMIARGEQIGLGDRIQYFVTNGGFHGNISDHVESFDYVIENNEQIDREWYIERQIIPPLKRIFDALHIDIKTGKNIGIESSLDVFM